MSIEKSVLFFLMALSAIVAFVLFREIRKKGANALSSLKLRGGWITFSIGPASAAYLKYMNLKVSYDNFLYFQIVLLLIIASAAFIYGAFYPRKWLVRATNKFMRRKLEL